MRRKKGRLWLLSILGGMLCLAWFAAGLFIGRRSIPRIQIMNLSTKKWVEIAPKTGMKLFCFVPDGFTPCGQAFAGSHDVEDLLGPSIVIVPKHDDEDESRPPKPEKNRLPNATPQSTEMLSVTF